MGIGLVADVEDDVVLRGIVNIMKGDDEFNASERGTEVTGILGRTLHHVPAEFPAEGPELFLCETPEILRGVYLI